MPRLRKSKSATNPPISTPVIPAELVSGLMSQRNLGALVAASSAIALPFGPTIYPSSDGTTVQQMDKIQKTAYSAVKMAVEFVKESSDLCLPLKAVAGAMSALMKNYDQASEYAKGVKDVERKAQSLSEVLDPPVSEDDYTEMERRVVLRRKLGVISAKLEPLSEEHVLLRFLHNIDNARTLAGFAQELADAITDYQVSPQQEVHREFRDIQELVDMEILEKLEPVINAGYKSCHHDKCLPGTREAVLQDILRWAEDPQGQKVFWLNGLAAVEPSVLASSVPRITSTEGSSRTSFQPSHTNLHVIIPTFEVTLSQLSRVTPL